MKNFLSTTALMITLSGAAMADGHASAFGTTQMENSDFFASDLIGMRIYNSETDVDENTRVQAGGETEWDDIGEINDIIVSADGEIRAVILGVGGFLGLGERDVTVNMDAIKVLREEGDVGARFLVVKTDKETLEAAPAFERNDDEMETETASADRESDTAIDTMQRAPLARPAVEREGFQEAETAMVTELTSDQLEGSYVYGSGDETVGEIDRLVMSDAGQIETVVVNVGGFLGLGEKPVGVTWDELQVLKNVEGDDFRIYIDSNKEALEAQPEYTISN